MPWQDRIQQAAYTSATGPRIPFDFEDVSTSFELFGTEFNYPDGLASYVQRTGTGSRRYPMTAIFSGPDHDLIANEFEKALGAKGIGVLEHPFYGRMRVVPFGVVEREDRLVTAANQTKITVVFWRADGITVPTVGASSTAETQQALADYAAKAAGQYADTITNENYEDEIYLVRANEAFLGEASQVLERIARGSKGVQSQFSTVVESINANIETLVNDPLTLAHQTVIALQAPARAAVATADRMEAYGTLARSIIAQGLALPTYDGTPSNTFHTADMYASTYVTGQVITALNTQYTTRSEAILAAEAILQLLSEVTEWREENFLALEEYDTGGDLQQLQESVASVAAFLVELSFSLKQEKRITLTHNRTPIDLCAELYGRVDEVLQFFIDTNNLSWQEHLEIMAGRRIVYYV